MGGVRKLRGRPGHGRSAAIESGGRRSGNGWTLSNYDDALERFHRVDLEYADGLANHGPMGAEALESLGHQALIPAFVDLYSPRLLMLEVGRPLGDAEAHASLGDVSRRGDWVATYEARLAGGDWRAVVASEVPPLLPGLFAGAGHGLLRVGHAVRGLEREDSVLRRHELARGLAHWAARYQTLPGLPGRGRFASPVELRTALADWPLVGEAELRKGLLLHAVARLEGFRAFAKVVEEVPLPTADSLDVYLGEICRAAAGLYLAQPQARIAYLHALTIPSALRFLVPHLSAQDACRGAVHALQAFGALHSIYGESQATPELDEEVVRVSQDWDEIRYHAARSIQEHSIKMTEACWREDRNAPDPVFRRAAADAALKIDGRGQPSVC